MAFAQMIPFLKQFVLNVFYTIQDDSHMGLQNKNSKTSRSRVLIAKTISKRNA